MKYKTPSGEKISGKEFMSRWKDGLTKVTPLQQSKIQYNSTWITIIGLIAGIIITIFAIKKLWWVLIILIGALGNTLMQLLGIWQKIQTLKKMESVTELFNPIEIKEAKEV